MDFCEQMFTKASQNSDISASCSENIVTVAFYVNVKSCRYFINRLALAAIVLLRPKNFARHFQGPDIKCKLPLSTHNLAFLSLLSF
jgi:hypothetical protein